MKVAIFEVCRRPEVRKANTEAMVLSQCFTKLGVPFTLDSNDRCWSHHPAAGAVADRQVLRQRLRDPSITVAHLAVHGDPTGVVLQWSGPLHRRAAIDVLTGEEIRTMSEWRDRLVVSGACASARLADDFLAAGAVAVVAPEADIPWQNLGPCFQRFYVAVQAGATAEAALAAAIAQYPELASYRVYACTPPTSRV